MRYRATIKKLIDGHWYVRCPTAPNGLVETQSDSREEALEAMRAKIRYQLEWCPCSSIADDAVTLDVVET